MANEQHPSIQKGQLSAEKNEDVEFSLEAADEDDLEALNRAKEADQRAAEEQ